MTETHGRRQNQIGRGLSYALAITLVFFGVELGAGLLTNSLALVADAVHMATDLVILLVSLGARWYSLRPAPAVRSWGYHRVEVLAALGNGVVLVLLVAFIYWQAVRRLITPEDVLALPMLLVAVAGLGANVAAAWLLRRDRKVNISAQAAYTNVVADALGSVGVIVGGAVMLATGWFVADAIVGMVIALLILSTAWRLLRTTVDILLETTPRNIDVEQVRRVVVETPGVRDTHDLHVWTLTTGFIAMSGHVMLEQPPPDLLGQQRLLVKLRHRLKEQFGIDHVTLQVEASTLPGEEAHCEGEPVCLA